jgi:NarL family two-component system sensor histidine kinase LiaS
LIGGGAATIRTATWYLAASGAASVIVLLLWLYLQRRIMRPVKYLTLAAEKIGAGNLDVEIGEIKIEDEIGSLSRAFRRMRSNLKHSQVELQKLTASLQQQIQERAEAYRALQQAQRELEITSRQIVEADDSSRFALTTYIHDEVLTLLDELVNRASKSGNPSLADIAIEIEQRIRRVRFGLSVPVIQNLDIELNRLLQEILPQFYPEAHRVKLDLDLACLKPLENLEPACTVLFYRFASGAVSNVYRHARAQKVSIEAIQSDSRLFLRVSDDGVGFDPGSIEELVSDGHYFFHDIAARARQLGGDLDIVSAPGSGTQLEVYVPIKRVMRSGKLGGRGYRRSQP